MWPGISPEDVRQFRTNPDYSIFSSVYRGGVRQPQIEEKMNLQGGNISRTSNRGMRGSLSMTVAEAPGLYEDLSAAGFDIWIYYVLNRINGTKGVIPMGQFDVDSKKVTRGSGGISITGKDYFSKIKRARFERPVAPRGPSLAVIRDMMLPVIPNFQMRNSRPSGNRIQRQIFARDRDVAIQDILKAEGLEGYFYRDGTFRTHDAPRLSGAAVFNVRGGERGSLVSADQEETREGVYNIVVVSPSGAHSWKPVVVEDRGASSPTRVDGPFGRVPRFYSSPFIRTREQAAIAGRNMLRKVSGMATTIGFSTLTHPGLDPGDLISVSVPINAGRGAVVERHIIDTIDFPFDPGTAQVITTRSTRPLEEGEEADDSMVVVM